MDKRIVLPGQVYRHFKGKNYQVICVAHHSETGESLVVYQALYGDFGICARPYDMFISEVDKVKYPDVKAKYRFELIGQVGPLGMSTIEKETISDKPVIMKEKTYEITEVVMDKEDEQKQKVVQREDLEEPHGVDKSLLEFLNAKTYSAKREILTSVKKGISDKLLNDIAVSLDFVLPEGDLTTKYEAIMSCLNAHARFEVNRR